MQDDGEVRSSGASESRQFALAQPLREPVFRRIWAASLFSNVGQLVQGVGAAWMMTKITASPAMVALVQTALMLPLMLISLPAGAIADMFDRRKVALAGLSFACVMALGLTGFAWTGVLTPWLLLVFCFLIGAGVALYNPAWQASVGEQVSPQHLPAAIALGTISYNVARSFGPALGGVIVAAFGAVAAFASNAIFYLPLIFAYLGWNRQHVASRLPPERIDRAIVAGVRYAIHSPPIRVVLVRTFVAGLAGASVAALTPLVAKDLLGGGAPTYGLLLGSYGIGAVLGATGIDFLRTRTSPEGAARLLSIVNGGMIVVVGLSHDIFITLAAMLLAGAAWIVLIAQLNVAVQLSAPRWVTARALSCFSCAITGGIAFGAFGWGWIAGQFGTGAAMVLSGLAFALTPLLGLLIPVSRGTAEGLEMGQARHIEVGLALTPRSGPIVIEIDYRVDPACAREYYEAMQRLRSARMRSGAFDWTLARDIGDPELWTEQYHCPTWGDYLHQRARMTQADEALQAEADAYHMGGMEGRYRRKLERPTGSVRWRADTPDRRDEALRVYPH